MTELQTYLNVPISKMGSSLCDNILEKLLDQEEYTLEEALQVSNFLQEFYGILQSHYSAFSQPGVFVPCKIKGAVNRFGVTFLYEDTSDDKSDNAE